MNIRETNHSAWHLTHRAADKEPIRVAIVEYSKSIRVHLAGIVENTPSLKLVKVCADAESALVDLEILKPQVIVMDIQLPNRDGIECTRFLKQRNPEMQVIIYSVLADSEHVMNALKAGASGYLLKNSSAEEMVRAIKHVWEGGVPMSPGIDRIVVEALHCPGAGTPDHKKELWQLTGREHEILKLLAKGFSAKAMAGHLKISEPTARFHLKNIYGKLHVHSHTQAVAKYLA